MAKRKWRTCTPGFKAEVVLEALPCETSQAELCRGHNLSKYQVSKGKQQFVENAVSVFAGTDQQSNDMDERVAPLSNRVSPLNASGRNMYELTSIAANYLLNYIISHFEFQILEIAVSQSKLSNLEN